MNFECLANELLLDIFEYFKIQDLFHAFYDLNYRFHTLLLKQFQSYHLDFKSISKSDFHLICQKYLPSIQNQIISLRLSDDKYTPGQTKYIPTYFPSFLQLSQLRALSLYCIESPKIMEKLLIEWHQLSYLTYLSIIKCNFKLMVSSHTILNSIWSLPQLVYCHLDGFNGSWTIFDTPDVTSSSIHHFSYQNGCMQIDTFYNLLENTPHLRYLNTQLIDYSSSEKEFSTYFLSLTRLNLSTRINTNALTFWKYLPNLTCLKICMERFYLDGKQWEHTIKSYLTNLKVFHLCMFFSISGIDNIEDYINRFMDSFRTSFWLEDHQWYIRCHWEEENASSGFESIVLYTLPYAFCSSEDVTQLNCHKSTCPDDKIYNSYDHIYFLKYIPQLQSLPFLFPNIRHLSITLPIDDRLHSIIPNLNNIQILTCYIDDRYDSIENELQSIFDRLPSLHTLKLQYSENKCTIFSNTKHDSIRYLEFQVYTFSNKDCEMLINSQLGQQCELLTLSIEHHDDLLKLVNQLGNLRSLKLRASLEGDNVLTSSEEELNDWLTLHLPSKCDFRLDYNTHVSYTIYIWLQ
ncbi:hypothetical protein I4U23_023178 [Adineta vaga]|nr:hypothetical protein I4U23_023178 [Adineta vaga]